MVVLDNVIFFLLFLFFKQTKKKQKKKKNVQCMYFKFVHMYAQISMVDYIHTFTKILLVNNCFNINFS